MKPGHLSDLDLERYYLGMVPRRQRNAIEEHLPGCPACTARAEIAQEFASSMRAAIATGSFDLDWLERNSQKKR